MKKINIAEKSFNPFDLIGQKWMLISAGTEDKWNTMTASWGAVGDGGRQQHRCLDKQRSQCDHHQGQCDKYRERERPSHLWYYL